MEIIVDLIFNIIINGLLVGAGFILLIIVVMVTPGSPSTESRIAISIWYFLFYLSYGMIIGAFGNFVYRCGIIFGLI